MGNQMAKDFYKMKLGKGTMTATGRKAIVPEAVVLEAAITVAVQREKKKAIQFFDVATQRRLFITSFTKNENTMGSVTKDARGNVLFVTKAPDRMTRQIFKPTSNFDKDIAMSEPSSVDSDEDELAPVAQIEIDNVASSTTAFLSVYVKKSSRKSESSVASSERPDFLDLYKAVQIPNVKYGAVVVDMRGSVVGKASHHPSDPFPTIEIATGADASAVIAVATSVLGDL